MANINKCIFCGCELIDGSCPNGPHFKAMCLNCDFCKDEDGKCYCNNPENKEDAINKIKASIPSGYEIEELKVKPLPLKDETKKCKRWNLLKNFSELYLNNIS